MAKKNRAATAPQQRTALPKAQQSVPTPAQKPPGKPFRWYVVLMPLIVLIWGLVYFETGEIIALNNGCGWDGVFYKNVVWSLQWNQASPELRERARLPIDPYRAQRVAPSVAVYGEMQVAKYAYQRIVPMFAQLPAWLEWSYEQYPLPPWFFRWFADSPNDVAGQQPVSFALRLDSFIASYFVIHSLLMLIGTALFWAMTARALNLGGVARWLGFTGLFVNFAVMKMSLYYPTLTDTTALFLAMVMLYSYCANVPWLLLPAAVVGFFTFPTAFYAGIVLFVLPRSVPVPALNDAEPMSQRTAQILAASVTVLLLLLTMYFVIIANVRFAEVETVYTWLLLLTVPLMLTQFFLTVAGICRTFPAKAFFQYITSTQALVRHGIRAGIGIALWGVLLFIKRQFEDPMLSAPMTTNLFLGGSLSCAVSKPLLTIVASAVYFGPLVLLVVVHYRFFLRTALGLGYGFFTVVAGMLLLATMMTESRQLINFLPFVVVGVAVMLNSMAVQPLAVAAFGVLSIVGSKIWLSLNFPGMQEQAANIHNASYAAYPLQNYFMNHGPWMSWTGYGVQAVVVFVACAVVWWIVSPESVDTLKNKTG
jgi:hypothetical protein